MAVADYAPSQASTAGPSPRVAALLTLLTPGLGHIYLGLVWRGIALFALVIAADTLLMFSLMGVLARFWMFAISLTLLFGLWLFIVIDATVRASRMREHPQQAYNRWPVYAAIAGCLAHHCGAVRLRRPCQGVRPTRLFSRHCRKHGTTLREGEYVLADATYYRTHKPSRGDVVVYIHPKQAGTHYIRRVVAMEGDRVAVRAGRAVVNGMAVEEPYVDVGDPNAPFNNMPETRVPTGQVFVLGDSRAHSSDSRQHRTWHRPGDQPDRACHGRGLLTHRTRMGRWIGTPSRL